MDRQLGEDRDTHVYDVKLGIHVTDSSQPLTVVGIIKFRHYIKFNYSQQSKVSPKFNKIVQTAIRINTIQIFL